MPYARNPSYTFYSDTTQALAAAAVDIAMAGRCDPKALHRVNAQLVTEHMTHLRGSALERAKRTVVHLDKLAAGVAHAWQ